MRGKQPLTSIITAAHMLSSTTPVTSHVVPAGPCMQARGDGRVHCRTGAGPLRERRGARAGGAVPAAPGRGWAPAPDAQVPAPDLQRGESRGCASSRCMHGLSSCTCVRAGLWHAVYLYAVAIHTMIHLAGLCIHGTPHNACAVSRASCACAGASHAQHLSSGEPQARRGSLRNRPSEGPAASGRQSAAGRL